MTTRQGTEDFHKRMLIALLYRLSLKDEVITEGEMSFINEMALRMNLNAEVVKEVIGNLKDFPFQVPRDEHSRMEILYQALFLMKIDQKVSKEEVQMIRMIGFKLGFRQALTNDLITLVIQNANKNVPVQKMLNNIRKYLN